VFSCVWNSKGKTLSGCHIHANAVPFLTRGPNGSFSSASALYGGMHCVTFSPGGWLAQSACTASHCAAAHCVALRVDCAVEFGMQLRCDRIP
jgi:hypothetical protein